MNNEQMEKLNARLTKDITRRINEVRDSEIKKKAKKKKEAEKEDTDKE